MVEPVDADSPGDGERGPRIWPVLLVLAVSAVRFLPFRHFTPDDYFIYLRYVENLLERGELAFNPGEPSYAFTSALWLGVIAGAARLFDDPVAAGKVCSYAASLASPVLVYFLVLRGGGRRDVALASGLAWASNVWLARWSASGLEAGLSAAVPLAVVLALRESRRRGRPPWFAAVLAAIAPFVRPEMIGLLLLFAGAVLVTDAGGGAARWRNARAAMLPGVAICGGAFAALYVAFGRVLPDTAAAKGSLVPAFRDLVPAAWRILRIVLAGSGFEVLVLLAAATAWIVASGRGRRFAVPEPEVVLAVCWVVGLAVLYGVRGVRVYTRYLLMLLPFLTVAAFVVVARLPRGATWVRLGAWSLGVAIAAQNVALDHLLVRPATLTYQRSEENTAIHLGRWLRDHTAPGAVVAAPDIGAIGYYSGRTILDLNGLVTPEALEYKRRGRLDEFLELRRPDYVIDVDADPLRLLRAGSDLRLEPLDSRPFDKMFLFQDRPLYYTLYRVGDGRTPVPGR